MFCILYDVPTNRVKLQIYEEYSSKINTVYRIKLLIQIHNLQSTKNFKDLFQAKPSLEH